MNCCHYLTDLSYVVDCAPVLPGMISYLIKITFHSLKLVSYLFIHLNFGTKYKLSLSMCVCLKVISIYEYCHRSCDCRCTNNVDALESGTSLF